MIDLTKELNEAFQRYQIGTHEIAFWIYLTLERMTEDYREIYEQELTQEEMKRLEDVADALNKITNQCWWLLK
ncbi:hypothetical protein CSW12_29410 (plasmid) [Bacillus cereus]|uniref:Uncharacterized protein n=2 Tax=Bacillus thuringiensis TaxID=1428 RepID=A0A9X6QM18_BACTU|nr:MULTISPECIES: hypothetical protein [Bacillus cereus group]MED3324714.1 hypothetical protein [Bacillus thuringiensis]AUB67002.1 hypothetical protein CSW12_29410 [Bacillus cereus]MEB9622593.1 hypothetical protein [Bacillus cereus]OOR61441.1 hypothetical protein BLX04_19460 [Bacillus mycoides]OTW55801.1 hypothetical protein BK699_00220 [Bacillus thuringiensis serovar mexicanensis]